MSLQRYRCHKIVEAAEIVSISGNRVWMKQSDPIDVSNEWLSRFHPETSDGMGGYFIRYADGYESWSPTQAFEEGYTRITDEDEDIPW